MAILTALYGEDIEDAPLTSQFWEGFSRLAVRTFAAGVLMEGQAARDDAAAMQFLIPGWRFDPRRPCMLR